MVAGTTLLPRSSSHLFSPSLFHRCPGRNLSQHAHGAASFTIDDCASVPFVGQSLGCAFVGSSETIEIHCGTPPSSDILVSILLGMATFMPVAWTLYVVDLWAWHHPALYQMALRNEWAHNLQHLLFFSTAILFWWPIANPAPRMHRTISYGFRIVYLIAATLQNTLLGMAISLPERVLYPFYSVVPGLRDVTPINDQALGGGIMWVSGHMYLIPILMLVARMFAHEEETLRKGSAEHLPNRAKA